MASMINIVGMPQVLSRLKGASLKLNKSLERGLVKGGHFLQRESQKIVPWLTGNLSGTAFTRKITPTEVIVGYAAPYAAFVHENLDAAHGHDFNVKHADDISRAKARTKITRRKSLVWFNRGEHQQAKFLERPAREKRFDILNILAQEARRI